ncbi:MAG: PSD1 and planctomycete cytochrome C domain-containing protein [Planctomycetota bacterium]
MTVKIRHPFQASWIFICTIAITVITVGSVSGAEPLSAEQVAFFESKIRPVLVKECYGCHSNKAGNVRGGLRLDTKQLMVLGGSSGPAVVPGNPDDSLLYTAMMHLDFEMPPRRKLSDEVLSDFRQWIEMGAPDPRETEVAEIKATITEEDIAESKRSFWAYQHPVDSPAPAVLDEDWSKTKIDRFVLAKLESEGIRPADDAEPHRILRRLCFDLTGLPPTPAQIDYFASHYREDADRAIAMVVDRLLESEQFGERWGRHWLDVVRYAESTGREVNMTFPHAWRFRDYVIDSFNADKPFDQFIQEQIAGDLMPAPNDEVWAENLVATTFLAMGPKNVNEQNRVQFAADLVDEQIDATTRVFLGMSVACARCHDHKFDAIPQTDYYAMAGIFGSMTTYFGNPPSEYGTFSTAQNRRSSSLLVLPVDDPNPYDKSYTATELEQVKSQISDLVGQLSNLRRGSQQSGGQNAIRDRLRITNQLSQASAKLAVVDASGNPRSYCMGVQESASPRDARLLVRGEIDQPAQTVRRDFPTVLREHSATIPSGSSGRLELARWIGSDENTLSARVMVNRIWQHLIGQGLVRSTENFGVTGQSPSHPELLDHLAVRFVDSGWSVKTLVKEIATSRTYRVSSDYDETSHHQDPDNALLWRANPRRLDAEAIRDAMLSVAGKIDLDRPRGSEVAKAGYTRVRDGVLGDPREAARKAAEQARAEVQASMRQSMAGSRNGQSRDGNRGRYSQGRAGAGQRGRFGQRGQGTFRAGNGGFDRESAEATAREAIRRFTNRYTNQLNMEDAEFRSVYLPIVRDQEPRSMVVFDFADSSSVIGSRESSNTANQALYMMNNQFVINTSDAFARRLISDYSSTADRIDAAFGLTYGRKPTQGERSATAEFIRQFQSDGATGLQTLSALCQSLFASAEFRYID